MLDPLETSILNASVSDRAAAKDALGFAPYVKAIAEFLTNRQTKPPLTLSVEGEWGSGKSSFMQQLQQAIEESSQKELKQKLEGFERWARRFLYKIFYGFPNQLQPNRQLLRFFWILWMLFNRVLLFISNRTLSILMDLLKWLLLRLKRKPKTVWFNAWRHDKAEALWAAFALEFIRQISTNRGIADVLPTFWGHSKLFWFRFRWKEGWLDALRTVAQLLLGISAIALIIIFSFLQGPEWVKQLSARVNNLNTTLQTKVEQDKKSATSKPDNSNKSKPDSPKKPQQENKQNESQKTDNPFSLPIGAAGIGGSSLIVISLWRQLQKLVGDPKKELVQYLNSPNYQGQIAFVEKFHKDFSKIVNAYVGKDKVYVFIDDLDRCELPKSAELMQALNLMISEDPSIVFILGMDREKVAAGLAVKYKELLPYLLSDSNSGDEQIQESRSFLKGLEYGYAFIEKFVQLPFLVPQPSDADFEYFLRDIAALTPPQLSLINRGWNASQKLIEGMSEWRQQFQQFISQLRRRTDNDVLPENQILRQQTPAPRPQTQEPPEEQKLERRERIKLLATEDSQTIRHLTEMVASALDYNPRRLKQFINLFRLRTYIASDTGLFDEWFDYSKSSAINQPLTLEQLGKFTAISLRWPLLIADLEKDPKLLAKLEEYVKPSPEKLPELDIMPSSPKNKSNIDSLTKDWGSRPKLRELLCYGICEENADIPNPYSLAAVEIENLLQISPKGGRRRGQIQSFTEELGNNVTLKILAIPEGKFVMGSPEDEPGRFDSESPQHEVTVQPFYMSQYLITQIQWREIASLRPVRRYLNPEPSYFKGDNLPVENISWYDAVEFCARLSKLTGREYRLPSEAEWEYACRSVISYQLSVTSEELTDSEWNEKYNQPFYFGETIRTDLANYNGDYTYAGAPKGEYRQKTTPVGQFPPNKFGLYDMHGNVWEWCADIWHENYEGAPNDGSAWVTGGNNSYRLLRGGSWSDDPNACRSANRDLTDPAYGSLSVGLRVVASSRT